MYFTGLKWDNETGRTLIGFRENQYSEKSNLERFDVGSDVTLEISDEVYCTGHHKRPEHKHVACGKRIKPGQRQCESCRIIDSSFFLPLSALSREQKSVFEQQPHFNYLNLFGPSTIKTGVVASVRRNTRVWEQGVHSSLFFASCNGVIAREIEEWVSQNFKEIKTLMQVNTKIGLLYSHPSEQISKSLLCKTLAKITEQIPDKYQEYLFNEPEFLYNINLYNLDNKSSVIYSLPGWMTSKLFPEKF